MSNVIYSPGVVSQLTTGPGALPDTYSYNGSSGYVYNPNGGTGTVPVSSYNTVRDDMEGYMPRVSRSDYSLNDIESFLDSYIKYNYDLFNDAQSYDVLMSNTAIRRQMEDLKAAGINPILAGRLGGAQYKGVTAPYVSINPASALGSLMNFQSDVYSADVNYEGRIREMALRENISENEMRNRLEVAERYVEGQLRSAGITAGAMVRAAEINGLTQREIQEMRGQVDIRVQELYNETMKEINERNISSEQEIAKNRDFFNFVGQGVRTIGTLIGAYIISHKNDRDPYGGYNINWVDSTVGAGAAGALVPFTIGSLVPVG